MSAVEERSLAYTNALTVVRDLLEKHMCKALSSNELDDAILANIGHLSAIPTTIFRRVFVEKTGDQNNQLRTPINQLSLYEIQFIIEAVPALKRHFAYLQPPPMTKLESILFEIYDFLRDPDHCTTRSQSEIDTDLMEILIGLGRDVDRLDSLMVDIDEQKIKESMTKLLKQLSHDDLFRNRYFKLIRNEQTTEREDGETSISPWRKKQLKKFQHLRDTEILSLDAFPNLRTSLLTPLRDALTCRFCQELLKDPRTLACLHSFCGDCLKSRAADGGTAGGGGGGENQQQIQPLDCAHCQTSHVIPSASLVEQLPVGFAVVALRSLFDLCRSHVLNANSDWLECFLCARAPTELCAFCANVCCPDHAAPCFHRHVDDETVLTTVRLSTFANDKGSVVGLLQRYCPQHRRPLTRFCPACRVPLCSDDSCVNWHAGHGDPQTGLQSLTDALNRQMSSLISAQQALELKAAKVKAKIAVSQKNQISVADMQENVRQSIAQYFKEIARSLETAQASFISDLDKAAAQCFQNDEQIHQQLQKWMIGADELVAEFQRSHTSGVTSKSSYSEVLMLHNRTVEQLLDACSGGLSTDVLRLDYPETPLRELQRMTETIKSKITAAPKAWSWVNTIPVPNGASTQFAIDSQKRAYFMKNSKFLSGSSILVCDCQKDGTPVSICDSGSQNFESFAIDRGTSRLYVLEQPKSVWQMPSMEMKRRAALHIFYAYTGTGATLLAHTMPIDQLVSFGNLLIKIYDDRFYVGDSLCICEFELQERKLMRKIVFNQKVSVTDFAVETRADLICLADAQNGCLWLYNGKHRSIKRIGQHGVSPGQFDHPCAVAIDAYGHVIVVDSHNFRLQLFDLEGRFLRIIDYPTPIKLAMSSYEPSNTHGKVSLTISGEYLYLADWRSSSVWKLRYL